MEGVKKGSSQLEVQKTREEQDTQPPTTPQYEVVTQESDLESVASSSASQSKRKRKSFSSLPTCDMLPPKMT